MKSSYKYFIPTENIITRGGLTDIAALLPSTCKMALLVTGKNSAKKFGYTDTVINSLKSAEINTIVFDQVEEDPSVETADTAAKIALKNNCDAVIGL
ncbi:iron-containing alcohol dehydrogenase, partial [bacterium]|nr:iron-containing alcohol dehydrogenase [bacterium]